jgi:hypothetical protein
MRCQLTKPGPINRATPTDKGIQGMNGQPKLIWLVPMAALAVALFDMPYGYYSLLRFLMCGVCLYLAVQEGNSESGWVWILGGCALLYNPLFKIHLGREVWSIVNVATIALLAGHMRRHSRAIAD